MDAQAATLAKLPLEPDPGAPGMGRTTSAERHLRGLALANLPFATMHRGLRPLLPDDLWKAGPGARRGFEVNGHKITAQVDALYTGSLLIYNDSIRGLGLDAEGSWSSEIRDFPSTDGGVKMKEAHARHEKFRGAELGGTQPTYISPLPACTNRTPCSTQP